MIVNVSALRCDALIIDPAGLRWLPMPWLTATRVDEQVAVFTAAIHGGRDPGRSWAERAGFEQSARAILTWLWREVTQPVLTELGFTDESHDNTEDGGRPLPRLWWVSTGALAFLPVHAAGE